MLCWAGRKDYFILRGLWRQEMCCYLNYLLPLCLPQALTDYKVELRDDPIINTHLAKLYDNLLEQNLIRVIEPFSRVQVNVSSKRTDVLVPLSPPVGGWGACSRTEYFLLRAARRFQSSGFIMFSWRMIRRGLRGTLEKTCSRVIGLSTCFATHIERWTCF